MIRTHSALEDVQTPYYCQPCMIFYSRGQLADGHCPHCHGTLEFLPYILISLPARIKEPAHD